MNINFKKHLIFPFFILLMLYACESHEQKVDDAFEQVKANKKNGTDSVIRVARITESPKIKVVVKNEVIDEYALFKKETEAKINLNEQHIQQLKSKKEKATNNSKFDKQIIALERKNNDLRKQMNDYYEEVKLQWAKFKLGINHDVAEIGFELNDIAIKNSKK